MCNDKVNHKQDSDESKCCGARIVKVHKPWHYCMFLMSVMEPGAGCRWNACCCHDSDAGCQYGNIIYAQIMMFTACCFVGMINSFQFGVGIYRKAGK